MILDHFDPFQGCTEGGDPLGRRNLKIFYKNHQNRSPGVYFIDLHRFTKPLTSLDFKYYRVIQSSDLANWYPRSSTHTDQ